MKRGIQSWVAKCQWRGRKEFFAGTFFTEIGDGIEIARAEAEKKAVQFFEEILPVKIPPPDYIRLIPGMIILHIDSEDE